MLKLFLWAESARCIDAWQELKGVLKLCICKFLKSKAYENIILSNSGNSNFHKSANGLQLHTYKIKIC